MMAAPMTFDPEFASPAEWARMYRAHGLQVVPSRYPMKVANDKRPALSSWVEFHNELVGDGLFDSWFPADCRPNMGVITGAASGGLLVVDLDLYKGAQVAEWWRSITNDLEPETWVQTTGGGGKQYFFRVPLDVGISIASTPIADIRCQGGFAMLPPSRHMSGKDYDWNPYRAPWECEIMDAPASLLDAIRELVGYYDRSELKPVLERTDNPATDLDAFGNRVDGREKYMSGLIWAAVLNLHRQQAGIAPDEDIAKEAHDAALMTYLRSVRTRLPGYGNLEGLEREGRGPTAFLAKWRTEMGKWHGKVAAEAAKPNPRPFEEIGSKALSSNDSAAEMPREEITPPQGIHATPFEFIDPSTIPPRAWVYGRHYIRKFVSTTVAPGGVGKTSLGDVEALAIVTGRPLLGIVPDERCNVWKWNGEDPLEELQRRLMAAICHYGIRPEEIKGRLFVDTGRVTPIIVATKTRDGAVINAPVIDQVIATIRANRIGVFTVDPFVACHRVSENDNSEIERVAKAWAQIADVTGCAIELVHHVRKTNGNEVSVEDGRGAVALLSAARSARALNRMTADEAARIGVKDPGYYFRTDNGKSNLAPPADGAQWFRMASEDLQNDTPMTEEAPARPSDKVGVVTAWEWPDMTADVTATDLHAVRAKVGSGRYRADPQSGQWVGYAIMEAVGIEPDDAGKAKAKALQRMWTETRALEEYDDKDEARRVKKFVRPGAFND